MATFITDLTDDVQIMLETETTGAFSKSELEVDANPIKAFQNSLNAVGQVANVLAERARAQLNEGVSGTIDVRLGIKIDGNGAVMIAQTAENAQLDVTIRFTVG